TARATSSSGNRGSARRPAHEFLHRDPQRRHARAAAVGADLPDAAGDHMTVAPALSARQVAAALGISYDLFIRTRAQLEARGFPRPLPLVSRGGRAGGPGEVGTGSPPGASGRKRGRPPLKWCADSVEDWKRDPRP